MAVSITRELGPLMTAIVLVGRIGARITAELGTMIMEPFWRMPSYTMFMARR